MISAGRRQVATLVAVVATLGLLVGCSTKVAGVASPLGALDSGSVAGLPVTDGNSGPRAGVADATLPVTGADGGEMDKLAVNTLADVNDYWSQQLPAVFTKQYRPVSRLTSYDSDGADQKVCAGKVSTAGVVNAFYCNLDNSVSWDRGQLLPLLTQNFGPLAVTMVLAHEMGHAIQYQLGPASGINQGTPSIVLEQQADCYAGAFMRFVAEGKAKHFEMSTGDGLNKVLATTFFVRDAPGGSFTDEQAHGNAFDRVFAFQAGFASGPKRCSQITVAEVKQRITESTFQNATDKQKGGNSPITDQNVRKVEKALKDVFTKAGTAGKAAAPKFSAGAANCPDAKATSPAAYCPASDTISLDMAKLKEIGTPAKKGQGTGIGDFAAFGEIASRYALSVQKAANLSLDTTDAALRTACLVGSWGAAMKVKTDDVQLTAGDLDKAIAELLRADSLIAADVNGKPAPAGFARVEAFRIGFLQGASTCTQQFN
jgi:predicted metalloprotease